MRSLLRIAGSALLLTLALVPRTAQAAVTGNIEGTVTDQATGKRLAGVTVTVTSPALQGEQTEFTDAGGHYIITELPPGEYLVRFYFSNINVERPGVFLQADRTLSVNVAIPTQKAEVKTYRITEKAPTVDVGNTQVQTQVTSELVRNTPVRGRTYDSVLTLAPGAATDATGFQFGGATGLENNFLIDGVNTTSPALGSIGTQLTLEFVGETEIITGGYNAEYGRATGGVVNVITKSGSNTFHGDVWFYVSPFQLNSPYTGRAFEAIQSKTHQKFSFDFGFDLGGPIVKDKVWFYVGFAPTFTTQETTRSIFSRQATAANIPMGARSYSGDLDASVGCPAYLDPAFCKNAGLIAPGFINQRLDGYDRTFNTDTRLYNWIAKFNFQLNPNNSLVLQYIGSPATTSGVLGVMNGSDTQRLGSTFDNTHDALLHFVSKLADRRLQLDVLVGYHYSENTTTPNPNGGNDSTVIDNRSRPLASNEDVAPCAPQMINGVTFNPCPVQNYVYGGLGFVAHIIEQRISAAASATYFARLGGTHALKVGFDFEDNIYKDSRHYTGGDPGGVYTILSDGSFERNQFASKMPGSMGDVATLQPGGFTATTTTLNYGVYARDSYNVGFIPGLTLNAGVRWEAQQVKDVNGNQPIAIYDNWAPRVGAIYDFTRKGRSKIYASYGWFYESIPLDLNDRQFSGEGIAIQIDTAACTPDMNGRIDPKTCKWGAPGNADVNGGSFGKVSPILKGQYSEEVVAGIQYDVGLDIVLGASYIHRNLGRIIEDLSPDGGNNYIIANPGDATDANTVKDLQKQITATTDPMKKADLQQTLALYQGVSSFTKPKRNYDALVLTATKRLSHNFLLLASYTYSRTLGNYPGLFSPSNGQTDPNISSQYDLRDLLLNREGPLPSDKPHNLKVQGSYFIPFGNNTVVLGIAFNGISGRPIEVLGRHPLYGRREVFILQRGSGGRTPFVTSFDFHVSYRRQLSRLFGFEAYADVFNLFNQQEITNVDDEYTASRVSPIQNGTVTDLANLKTTAGVQPLLNPNYGRATAYQQPLSMRLGLRLSF
ncbi:MAG: TonB-dependent receptor plug [Myxococcales bacterium]|nr:TonB-dependent receptor plug [Myxococcales bacterium]